MGKTKEEIDYYVSVGSNGIGYETRCSELKEARELYAFRKVTTCSEVTLYKYNYTRGQKKIINHRKAYDYR